MRHVERRIARGVERSNSSDRASGSVVPEPHVKQSWTGQDPGMPCIRSRPTTDGASSGALRRQGSALVRTSPDPAQAPQKHRTADHRVEHAGHQRGDRELESRRGGRCEAAVAEDEQWPRGTAGARDLRTGWREFRRPRTSRSPGAVSDPGRLHCRTIKARPTWVTTTITIRMETTARWREWASTSKPRKTSRWPKRYRTARAIATPPAHAASTTSRNPPREIQGARTDDDQQTHDERLDQRGRRVDHDHLRNRR